MICTHGIGDSRHTFDALVAELSPDHTVITWDLPAHGDSPVLDRRADYDRDRVVRDIDDIVAMRSEPPVLLGHSLGGYLTLAWAVSHPGRARGLVILATGPGFRDPEKRARWNAMSERNAHRFGVVAEAAEMNLQHDAIVIEGLESLTLPVVLFVGDQDNPQLLGGMQYLEAKLPDAQLTVVEGGRHAMHEDQAVPEVASAVRALTDT